MKHKIMCISMCLVIWLNVFSGVTNVVAEISDEETVEIESIELNTKKTIFADTPREWKSFKFIPEKSGTYKYYSLGENTIRGYITDADQTMFVEGNNHDESGNNYFGAFYIECDLVAGKTYYLDSSLYESESGSYSVIVEKFDDPTSMDITLQDGYECGIGEFHTLYLSYFPEDTRDFVKSWISDNPDVVYVDETGTIYGKSFGKATITVTTETGLSDSVEINVVDNPEIKVDEKIIFWRLSESKGYKFIPTIDGEYRIGISGIGTTKLVTVYNQSLEEIQEKNDYTYELNGGEVYYIITGVYDNQHEYNEKFLFINLVSENVSNPTPIPTATPEATEIIVLNGDVCEDGKVDALDALAVLKHAAKLEILSDKLIAIADLNMDEKIDANDALEILKIAAKIE